jgi:hypothetical protein
MNRIAAFVFSLLFLCLHNSYCDQDIDGNNDADVPSESNIRTIFLPSASYKLISFESFQLHNISGGVSMIRIDPAQRNNLFTMNMTYSPQYASKIDSAYPDLYHNVSLMAMKRLDRHVITCSLITMTEKPLYGGLNTFMGMAGYSNSLIRREHFSLNLGAMLVFMDIGLTLDNGIKWLFWPLPMISFSWNYEWIHFGFMPEAGFLPSARVTIGPSFPVSVLLRATFGGYDAALRYRYFKDGKAANEIISASAGIKKENNRVTISNGGRYGVEYNSIYCSFRFFRFFEVSAGWLFNGKTEYSKISWDSIFDSGSSIYSNNAGNGYYISFSIRMGM